jgi:hypothetical protein
MIKIAFALTYLVAAAVVVVLFNANSGDEELALILGALASVMLGLGTGRFAFALLPFLAIPFAIPFGYPNDYVYSEPLPIWWWIAVLSLVSSGLVIVAVLSRLTVERVRRGSYR